jgi:hypothetical protein
MNPVETIRQYFFNAYFNTKLPPTASSSYRLFSFRFSNQNFVRTSLPCVLHALPTSFSFIWSF